MARTGIKNREERRGLRISAKYMEAFRVALPPPLHIDRTAELTFGSSDALSGYVPQDLVKTGAPALRSVLR